MWHLLNQMLPKLMTWRGDWHLFAAFELLIQYIPCLIYVNVFTDALFPDVRAGSSILYSGKQATNVVIESLNFLFGANRFLASTTDQVETVVSAVESSIAQYNKRGNVQITNVEQEYSFEDGNTHPVPSRVRSSMICRSQDLAA